MVTLPPGPGSDMHPLGPRSENLLGREGVEPGACSTCSPPHTHSAEGGARFGARPRPSLLRGVWQDPSRTLVYALVTTASHKCCGVPRGLLMRLMRGQGGEHARAAGAWEHVSS